MFYLYGFCVSLVSRARLVDGTNSAEGRIEVFLHGRWGTVCDDGFDIKEAHVFCQMLGLSPAQRVAKFGSGTGLIWLDDLNCRGNKTSINECSHREIGSHNCGYGENAGVVCTGSKLLIHSTVIIIQWNPGLTISQGDVKIIPLNRDIFIPGFPV